MGIDNAHYSTVSQRRILSNIISIAAEEPSREQALSLILDELDSLAPWAAMSLSVYDPLTRKHRSAVSSGYSQETVAYLDNSYMSIDPAYRWIVRTGKSYFSWETTEFDYSKSVSARNWWLPGGYKGGSTSYLTTRSNRYVGNLHTSTDNFNQPSLEILQLIDDISPILATLIDVWQGPRSLLRNLKPDEFPLFVDFSGNIHNIPGYRSCDWNGFRELARLAVKRGGNGNSLDVLGQRLPSVCWCSRDENIHQVQFKRCDRGWLVVRKASQLPFGLTVRQAEVCSLSAMGLTSCQIADVLKLSARTIERHIENIFGKTLINNRIELACFAASAGLIRLSDLVSYMDAKNNRKSPV